eukprot:Hpha_TRINITY_DN16766_c0_g1::TRINITY_DN16766_c0_g1_i5::g.76090::m.76090
MESKGSGLACVFLFAFFLVVPTMFREREGKRRGVADAARRRTLPPSAPTGARKGGLERIVKSPPAAPSTIAPRSPLRTSANDRVTKAAYPSFGRRLGKPKAASPYRKHHGCTKNCFGLNADAFARFATQRAASDQSIERRIYFDGVVDNIPESSPSQVLDKLGWSGWCVVRDVDAAMALIKSGRSCRIVRLCGAQPTRRSVPKREWCGGFLEPVQEWEEWVTGVNQSESWVGTECVTGEEAGALAGEAGIVLFSVPAEQGVDELTVVRRFLESAAKTDTRYVMMRRPNYAAVRSLLAAGFEYNGAAYEPVFPSLWRRGKGSKGKPGSERVLGGGARYLVLADVAEGMGAASSAVGYSAKLAAMYDRTFIEPHLAEHTFKGTEDPKSKLPPVTQVEYKLTSRSNPASDFVTFSPAFEGRVLPSPGVGDCGLGPDPPPSGGVSFGTTRLPVPLISNMARCVEALAKRVAGEKASVLHVLVRYGSGGKEADFLGFYNIACPSSQELRTRWPVWCPLRNMNLTHMDLKRVGRELHLDTGSTVVALYNMWARASPCGAKGSCAGLYPLMNYHPQGSVKMGYVAERGPRAEANRYLESVGLAEGKYAMLHLRFQHIFKYDLDASRLRECAGLVLSEAAAVTEGLPLLVMADSVERLHFAPPEALRLVRAHSGNLSCFVNRRGLFPVSTQTTLIEVHLAQSARCSNFFSVSYGQTRNTSLGECLRHGGRYGSTFAHNICRAREKGKCKTVHERAKELASSKPRPESTAGLPNPRPESTAGLQQILASLKTASDPSIPRDTDRDDKRCRAKAGWVPVCYEGEGEVGAPLMTPTAGKCMAECEKEPDCVVGSWKRMEPGKGKCSLRQLPCRLKEDWTSPGPLETVGFECDDAAEWIVMMTVNDAYTEFFINWYI